MVKPTTINAAVAGGLALTLILTAATTSRFSKHEKAFYADANTVAFVRPGLVIAITSAEIATDGTISVVFSLRDPAGAPLDRAGISTPGAIGLNFIAAYIPQGQQQYVDYITRSADWRRVWDSYPGGRRVERCFCRRRRRLPLHLRYEGAVGLRPDDDSHNRYLWITRPD